jgi:hypothetical protein
MKGQKDIVQMLFWLRLYNLEMAEVEENLYLKSFYGILSELMADSGGEGVKSLNL